MVVFVYLDTARHTEMKWKIKNAICIMIFNKNACKILKGNLCLGIKIMSRRHHYPSITTMVADEYLGSTVLILSYSFIKELGNLK